MWQHVLNSLSQVEAKFFIQQKNSFLFNQKVIEVKHLGSISACVWSIGILYFPEKQHNDIYSIRLISILTIYLGFCSTELYNKKLNTLTYIGLIKS